MPVLSAKTQNSGFEALAAKVEAKKKEEREKKIANEELKTFSVKSLYNENASETGTIAKNSTVKKRLSNRDNESKLDYGISLKSSSTADRQKQVQTEATKNKEPNKTENGKKSERSSSIISGSQKIQELQEIQKQLNKSYEPKPLFEPRRPTMESIKSAIEKAKQDEASRNKNVGTEDDDVVTIVTTSDASTSVDKIFKKKKKQNKKKTPDIASGNSAGTSSVTNKIKKRVIQSKHKKVDVDVKVKAKIESKPSETAEKPTN